LIHALLEDGNQHRRHAAARALGWIRCPGRAAAVALSQCVVDPAQPQAAREEAAESLAYVGTRETIDPLIAVLRDPDVRIRFWAVFGLGGRGHWSARTVQALESMLGDHEVPPGNWWSVGKEALAMLANIQPPVSDYEARLKAETQRVFSDPDASAEDRRWAEAYDRDPEINAWRYLSTITA
jgi:HEAT repeat protein